MDSDLAESITALRTALTGRGLSLSFGRADAAVVERLKARFRIPRRFRDFLLESDPIDIETITPTERVRLVPASDFEREQAGLALGDDGEPRKTPAPDGWRAAWIVVGRSTLLGDPYFLDVEKRDAEGDCPVYTAMSGTDTWQPRLCASTFATFLRILALGLDVARGFDVDDFDADNEQVFREALAPRIREYDPAALKAGHWT